MQLWMRQQCYNSYRWSQVLIQVSAPIACRRAAQNNWSLSSGNSGSVMQAQALSSAACTVPAKFKIIALVLCGRAWGRVPAPPCDTTTLNCGNSHECATVPVKFITLGGGEGGESHPCVQTMAVQFARCRAECIFERKAARSCCVTKAASNIEPSPTNTCKL